MTAPELRVEFKRRCCLVLNKSRLEETHIGLIMAHCIYHMYDLSSAEPVFKKRRVNNMGVKL
jgi:hypothetical protein